MPTWAESQGHLLTSIYLFSDARLPDPSEFDWLVIMGGPMSVHGEKRFSWLSAEKRLIERSLKEGKPILGICLGAQLIADVLGARVYRNAHKEVGWFLVRRATASSRSQLFQPLPSEFTAFHWHGEIFDLPEGSVHLAESDACSNQAFEYKSSLALQFHLECRARDVEQLIEHCAGDLGPGFYQQNADQIRASL